MRARKLIAGIMMLMIVLTAFPAIESQGDTSIRVVVLIDFGDGVVHWQGIQLDDNLTAIKATEEACDRNGLDLETVWFSFGVFVNGIGGLHSPDDWSWWWSLWVWNGESGDWEASMEGASDLILEEGDRIAWSPSASKPIAEPETEYPWGQFQMDSYNTGMSGLPFIYIKSNGIKWIFDTQTIEMPSSPVVAGGRIIINNWGSVFCLSDEGQLLWRNEEVVGSFTPAIGSGKVLVGGKDGFLYSLNITNGEVKWKTQITEHPGISGITSPPTIVRGKVYIGAFNFSGGPGALFCLDEETGNVIWENTTYSSVYFSSPAFSEDRVYIGTMGSYDSSTLEWNEPYGMYCYDANNGDLLWNYMVDGSVGSSPTISYGSVLFTSKDGHLYRLNGTTGNMIWKKNIGSSVSSPAVTYNSIYVGSGDMGSDGKFYRLDMSGNIVWQFTPNGAVQSSPAVDEEHVYFATNVRNGSVYCLNLGTGNLVWQYQPWPESYIISSPAIVNWQLYIASDNGRLYCFDGEEPYIGFVREHTTETLNVREDASFIHHHEGHILRILTINSTSASLKIDSIEEPVDVHLNEVKFIDDNGDGKKDLAILLNDVNVTSQEASITLYHSPYSEDSGLNMVVVSILALFFVGLVIMVVLVLVARRVSKKTGAPESGKKKKKDSS
jgi:outer membrane protein assembly factor BamB